jgi:peptidoglycan/LPS O-acetylase OafA/YrhL
MISSKAVLFSSVFVLIVTHALIGPTTPIGRTLGNADVLRPVMGNDNNIALYLENFVEAIAATVVVLSIAATTTQWSPLNSSWSQRLGDVSYSLYMLHLPVLFLFLTGLVHFWPNTLTVFSWSLPFITCCAVVPISLAFAYLSFRYIEAPSLSLSKELRKLHSDRSFASVEALTLPHKK